MHPVSGGSLQKCDCRRLLARLSRLYGTVSRLHERKDTPRITVPQKMVQNIHKSMTRETVEKARQRRVRHYTSPLVISCKRSEFNHHKGQTYSEFNPKHLASYGWKHKGSHGDYFTIVPHEPNPALTGHYERFEDLGIHADIAKGLQKIDIIKPTNIQEKTIPKILKGHCVLSAAETGSGKTLAYLTPIVQLLHRQKQQLTEDSNLNSPKAIILVPSRELADQIMCVAEKLAEFIPFKPHSVCGGRGTMVKLNYPSRSAMDILISTPGVLNKLLHRGIIRRNQVQQLVLDEMDTLMDDSFNTEILSIVKKLQIHPGTPSGDDVYVNTGTQVILVGATIPRNLSEILGNVIPADCFIRAVTDHVHRLMPHVSQKFMRLRPSAKSEEILRIGKRSIEKNVPTLMFCNQMSTCCWLSYFLQDNKVDHIMMNGRMPERVRNGIFEGFQSGEHNILVSTDIASRGLDTLRVRQVVNYEFPGFMSDYIHRAGRAGRVGSHAPGQVTSFISQKWEVDLVSQIEVAARRMTELHNVNANIKRKLTSIIEKKFGVTT